MIHKFKSDIINLLLKKKIEYRAFSHKWKPLQFSTKYILSTIWLVLQKLQHLSKSWLPNYKPVSIGRRSYDFRNT